MSRAACVLLVLTSVPVWCEAQDLLSYESRRTLLESRSFEPLGIPAVSLEDRSVFFDVPRTEERAAIVVLEGVQLVPAFPMSVFHVAGWLSPQGETGALGEVTGFADGRDTDRDSTTGLLYEDLYIRFSAIGTPEIGSEFLLFETPRTLEGIGTVAVPSGRVRVIEVGDGQVVAEIVQAFGRVQIGHLVVRPGTYPLEPGVRPLPVDRTLQGRILAMQEEKEIDLPGDFVFVDLGRAEGLALGDEFVGRSDVEADWAGRDLARFQVVGLREDRSTMRVVWVQAPRAVRPGLRVVLDRKMP